MPEQVKRAAEVVAEGGKVSDNGGVVDDGEGRIWLVRAISGKAGDFCVLAVDLGPQVGKIVDTIRERVDAVLADATGMLDRLDLAHALSDARVHSETETLRDALIGSVSHQLRTPLASILGTATVISRAPGNSADPRLASLAENLRDEVDRLNNGVQDLLDAALISSKGVRMDCEWVEVADIVNATVDRRQRLLAGHRVILDTAGELPLVYVDPILLEQALGQIVDNAAKYSQPGATITVAARTEGVSVVLSVQDEGIGLVGEELTRLWERFFRGERCASNVPDRVLACDRESLRDRKWRRDRSVQRGRRARYARVHSSSGEGTPQPSSRGGRRWVMPPSLSSTTSSVFGSCCARPSNSRDSPCRRRGMRRRAFARRR